MKLRNISILLLMVFLVLSSETVFASFTEYYFSSDTNFVAKSDSTVIPDTSNSEKDEFKSIVFSSAKDSLIFDVKNKRMILFNFAKIKFETTILTAGKIEVDFSSKNLHASSIETTDSLGEKILVQNPILTDNGEEYKGSELVYNFNTKQGVISLAENKQGYKIFRGQKVNKVAENIYFVRDGIFTTCKGNPPVTYFKAKEMKIIKGDKVIAKWIWMYIAGVPLPIPVPFAVFPLSKGRRSGIVIPTYGEDSRRGFYLRGAGYYFAFSDYFDLTLLGDLYFKGGFGLRSRFRYKKRYDFSGELNLGYSNIAIGEIGDPDFEHRKDWEVRWRHSQIFSPNTKMSVNIRFYSSDYLANNSIDYDNLYKQNVISTAKFSHRWDGGSSINLNYNRVQNLRSGDVTEKLPEVSYNLPIIYPFAKGSSRKKFYEKIGIRYNSRFRNEHTVKNGEANWKAGMQHNLSLNSSGKIGYFNFTPSLNYTEKWYDNYRVIENRIHEVTDNSGNSYLVDSLVERKIYSFSPVRTFNFSLSASTKFYGIAQINNFGIEAFRHTVKPSVSYVYKPDFSEEKFGYYGYYKKADGSIIKYDKFSDGIFGGSGSGKSQRINFSLNNIYEIKTMKDPTDTTSHQKKIKLLNLNLSSSYNFAADSIKLSDLRVSYRTNISDIISFNGNSTFTFYDFDGNRKINRFLLSENKGIFRQTSNSFSINLRLTGKKLQSLTKRENRRREIEESEKFFNDNNSSFQYSREITEAELDEKDFSLPWSFNLTYNYGFSKPTPEKGNERSTLNASLSFNLTKKWKFTLRGNYDLIADEISAPVFTAYRDLGCWEMLFTWYPFGTYSGFRFNIHLKAPELRDIKLEKSKNIFSGR